MLNATSFTLIHTKQVPIDPSVSTAACIRQTQLLNLRSTVNHLFHLISQSSFVCAEFTTSHHSGFYDTFKIRSILAEEGQSRDNRRGRHDIFACSAWSVLSRQSHTDDGTPRPPGPSKSPTFSKHRFRRIYHLRKDIQTDSNLILGKRILIR